MRERRLPSFREVDATAVVAVALGTRRFSRSPETTERFGQYFQLSAPELFGLDPNDIAVADDPVLLDRDVVIAAIAGDRHNRIRNREVGVRAAGEVATARHIVRAEWFATQPTDDCTAAGVGHTTTMLGDFYKQLCVIHFRRHFVGVGITPRLLLPRRKLNDDSALHQLGSDATLGQGVHK